jgi:flagellar hook-length control protein FliK
MKAPNICDGPRLFLPPTISLDGASSAQGLFASVLHPDFEEGQVEQRRDTHADRTTMDDAEDRRGDSSVVKDPLRTEPTTVSPSRVAAPTAPGFEVEPASATGAVRSAPVPPLQQLAAQMLRRVNLSHVGDQTALKMEISTSRLCRVGLELRLEGGRLTARFSVPDLAGRELIRSATEELEAGLGARGIAVESITVELDEPTRASRRGGERRQGDDGQRQRQRDEQDRGRRRGLTL